MFVTVDQWEAISHEVSSLCIVPTSLAVSTLSFGKVRLQCDSVRVRSMLSLGLIITVSHRLRVMPHDLLSLCASAYSNLIEVPYD